MATEQNTHPAGDLVVLDYNRLLQPVDDELLQLIEKAYGLDGLGVLAVKNVPDYLELRNTLLPLSHAFGNLPAEVQNKYEDPASSFSFGWSLGKEKLEGRPDFAKGSYYNNPLLNEPTTDAELIAKYPGSLSKNIWPSQEDFPGLEEAFMGMGKKICDVGLLITAICEAYVKKHNPLFGSRLSTSILESKVHKARLLYYYPVNTVEDIDQTWCGFHWDSGSLTGLTSAMFFNEAGEQIPNPDPQAGLYVKSRQGIDIQVKIPADCVAFQIGECFQIHSGGLLQATPHTVRASSVPNISRSTFACFLQPHVDYQMDLPPGTDMELVLKGANGENLPKGAPPLLSRWDVDGSQNYGQFAEKTFSMYY